MSTKTIEKMSEPYVGELIRREIKAQKFTNGLIIAALIDAGIEMSDTKFSNKIYGTRERFTEQEVNVINATFAAMKIKTKFKVSD